MLYFVWVTSCVLAGLSILVMLLLVVRRMWIEQVQKRQARTRELIRRHLIRFTVDHDEDVLIAAMEAAPPQIVVSAAAAFLELVRGDDRIEILRALAAAGLPSALRSQLRKGHEAQQLAASELLVSFPYTETKAELHEALIKATSEVRISSAIALAKLNDLPELATVLRHIGARGQHSGRLLELFRALPVERYDELFEVIDDTSYSTFVRASAIGALGQQGNYTYLDQLHAFSTSSSAEIAAAAVSSIGQIGHPRSARVVQRALAHDAWEVRLEAAGAAGHIGGEDCVPLLEALLTDEEWAVRYTAAKSLLQIGPAGRSALAEAAQAAPSRKQRTASFVLAEGGPANAL